MQKRAKDKPQVSAESEALSDTGQQVLDYAREGIIVCDRELNVRVWNRYLEELSGTSAAEVMGKHPLSVFPHLRETEAFPYLERVLAGESITAPDIWFVRSQDGADICLSCRFGPLYDAGGEVIGIIVLVSDVTERKRIEEALRHSEKRYRALIEANGHRVWGVDSQGRSSEVAGWWTELTGQPQEAGQGWGWLDVAHPDDREATRRIWEQAFTIQTPYHVVFRVLSVQGRYHTLEVRGVPLLNEDGSLREWIGTFTDITAQREAEEALRRSRQQFADLVNTVDGIVWEVDPETFTFTFVSPQAERILGYPLAQWIGDPEFWSSHILPEDREEAVDYCRRATAELRDHNLEYRMRAADGRIVWIHDLVSVVVEEGKPKRLRGLMVDITEQKRLQEQLLQAQKMESIGRLAGGVAHDFNNLLTAIIGYTELAEESVSDNETARRLLETVRQASERAANLTDQLLTFARRRVIAPQVVNLNALIEEVHGLLERVIGEHIELEIAPFPGLWLVRVDTGQFEQVLLNLAVNARDAMPRGGKLTIETANVTLDAEFAREHPGVVPGDYALLTVSDTGVGMEEVVRKHIFEPFFTTKPVGKGTGLGLATCLGIVEQNGGHIWVASEPGQGTTFRAALPRVNEDRVAPVPSKAQEKPAGWETILVVEDEPLVREIAVTTLQKQGYTILEAAAGEPALQLAQRYASPIHLLMTDVVMPQMGGVELAEHLQKLRPDIRVLYTSGYTENALVNHGAEEGSVAFLPKPYSPAQLARKVRETLEG